MTELLESAITRLQTLSESEQNAIAAIILEEIEDERRWDEAFSRSPDLLAQLAASAMAEYHGGKTHRKNLFGCMQGKIKIADDFNAPLKDFAEYME